MGVLMINTVAVASEIAELRVSPIDTGVSDGSSGASPHFRDIFVSPVQAKLITWDSARHPCGFHNGSVWWDTGTELLPMGYDERAKLYRYALNGHAVAATLSPHMFIALQHARSSDDHFRGILESLVITIDDLVAMSKQFITERLEVQDKAGRQLQCFLKILPIEVATQKTFEYLMGIFYTKPACGTEQAWRNCCKALRAKLLPEIKKIVTAHNKKCEDELQRELDGCIFS